MKEIPLTKGYVAIVDDEDYQPLSKYSWIAHVNGGHVCAIRSTHVNGKSVNLRMHRVIMNAPRELEIDHVNGDPLDNRKSNLRLCTHQQNCHNFRKYKGKSRYKGVYPIKGSIKWGSQLRCGDTCYTLGRFMAEEEAAHAYDTAARKHFGEFARCNFPNETQEAI